MSSFNSPQTKNSGGVESKEMDCHSIDHRQPAH
uniref:Dmrt1 n=1 Tax=Romanomermis culicivorax TaxID=13658 RepID=A0A915JK99_ROMCU